MSTERTSAARSAIWSLVENAALAVVSFASLVVYSRFLSPSDFGLFSMVLALVEILSVVVGMLFHDALVQQPDVTDVHFDTAFTSTVALSVALLGLCAVFAPVFGHAVGAPEAGRVLRWTALALPFTALSATLVPLQRRRLEFRALALRSTVGRLTGAALGIVAVVLGAHFWGLVVQYVLVSAVGSGVLWVAASKRPRLRFRASALRSMLGFGVYSVGGWFLSFAVTRIFMILVGASLGPVLAGYLNLSFRMVDVLWAIAATAVSQAALPVFSRLQSDSGRLKRAYGAALELTCLGLYPCFVGIALTAPELVELLFGRTWLVSTPYVVALALLVVVRAPRLLSRPVLTAMGRPQDALVGTVADVVVMIALVAASGASTLPRAMLVWCGREMVPMLVMAYVLRRQTGIAYGEQLRGIWPALVASACMAVAVCAARAVVPPDAKLIVRLAALVLVGAASFAASAWLFERACITKAVAFVMAARRARGAPVISPAVGGA